jgi:hypothetical protein
MGQERAAAAVACELESGPLPGQFRRVRPRARPRRPSAIVMPSRGRLTAPPVPGRSASARNSSSDGSRHSSAVSSARSPPPAARIRPSSPRSPGRDGRWRRSPIGDRCTLHHTNAGVMCADPVAGPRRAARRGGGARPRLRGSAAGGRPMVVPLRRRGRTRSRTAGATSLRCSTTTACGGRRRAAPRSAAWSRRTSPPGGRTGSRAWSSPPRRRCSGRRTAGTTRQRSCAPRVPVHSPRRWRRVGSRPSCSTVAAAEGALATTGEQLSGGGGTAPGGRGNGTSTGRRWREAS